MVRRSGERLAVWGGHVPRQSPPPAAQQGAVGGILHQRVHASIAATLEDRFSEIVLAQPALLAILPSISKAYRWRR